MRILDRVVAGVFAAFVAALAVVAVIEIVYAAVGDGPYFVVDWPVARDAFIRNNWSDTGPLVFGGVVAAVGLLVCLVALRPGLSGRLPATPFDGRAGIGTRTSADEGTTKSATTTFVRRRNLAHALRRAAESVDGVTQATVRIGRRRVTTRVSLRPRTSDT
nr:DUF6286 domain-containing protein [Micromonospora sp. DSM 115978]